jgi:hypothetical protein
MPRCGRSQLRKRDQTPSIVFTGPSPQPSPSSARAYSPRPWGATRMSISPGTQAGINAGLIRIPKRPWRHGVFDERLTGLWLHLRQQGDDPLTATRHHAQDGWPLCGPWAAPTCTLESVATSFAPRVLHHLRWPLMAGTHIGFVALSRMGQGHGGLLGTSPSRRGVVICGPSRRLTSSSWASGSVDQCHPMTDRHNPHTFRG